MADVTISSLPLGTPSGSALLPYSQGGQTLAVAPSGIVAASPGCLLQIKQAVKTNTQSFNTASYNDVTGLTVSITPKALNSSFLIQVQLSVSSTLSQAPYIRITRNGNPIGIGDAAGSRTLCNAFMYNTTSAYMITIPISYLDTPTYSTLTPITYKVQVYANSGPAAGNVGVNYYVSGDYDHADQPRASSSIIVQEIVG